MALTTIIKNKNNLSAAHVWFWIHSENETRDEFVLDEVVIKTKQAKKSCLSLYVGTASMICVILAMFPLSMLHCSGQLSLAMVPW